MISNNYADGSDQGTAIFDNSNANARKAATSNGSVWWLIGQVPTSDCMSLPSLRLKSVQGPERQYRTDSRAEMRETREF